MDDVEQAWDAIDRWMARFAPGSSEAQHPPAEATAVAAAEGELGLAFPDDVRRSLLHHDGQPRYCTDFPGYPLLPVQGILETRRMMMELAAEEDELGRDDSDDCWWHESWLPVAELDSDRYVVDLRPGPGYGRLGWFPRNQEVDFDQVAPTLAAHLSQVATALTTGGAVDDDVPYVTASGFLHWDYPGQEATDDGEALQRAPVGQGPGPAARRR
jgi:cell wall assembly regulator SMI1